LAFPCRCRHRPSCSSRCCRSAPLSRSPSPSRLLQRCSGLCAARTNEHQKCSSSGASHEVPSKTAPPSMQAACVLLTRSEDRAKRLPTSSAVPSLPFLTTTTVSSANDRVGLLHPTTDHGVCPVAGREPTLPPTPDHSHGHRPFGAFPSRRSGPPHRTIAGAFTDGPAPLVVGPLPSCRTSRSRSALEKSPPPQGFPRRKSVAHTPRCRGVQARCSLGLSSTLGFHPVARR